MKKFNLIFSAAMVVLCVLVILESRTFPEHSLAEGFGAGFYPIIVAIVIIGLCLVLVIQTLVGKSGAAEAIKGLDWKSLWRPLFYVVCMALFAVLLQYLGLLIDSFLFVTATMLSMKVKVWQALLLAAATAVVMYVGFDILLNVPFPAGVLFGG